MGDSMKKKYLMGMCIAILAVHMVLIIFWGMQKKGFHEDEYYSYFSSAGYLDVSPYGPVMEKSGYDVQRQFLVTDANRFNYSAVVEAQSKDVHPPLFYLTLNTLMSLFANRFYKWFGIGLNAVYSLISCCGIIILILNLDRSRYRCMLAGIAGLAYAISPAMISNVMFTRMYTMSAMWTIIYANIFVVLMRSLRCPGRKFIGLAAAGGVVCYLSFLTHYFCLIMAFFLTLGACIHAVARRKGIVRMLGYGITMVVAIGLAVLTFPASIGHIFRGYRGQGAIQGLSGGDLFGMLRMFSPIIDKNFFGGLMVLALIMLGIAVAVGIFFTARRRKSGIPTTYIWTVAIILSGGMLSVWVLSRVSLFVGDVSSRFFYPVGAVLIPVMAYCISKAGVLVWEEWFSGRKFWPVGILLAAAALFWNIAGQVQGNILFLYRDEEARVEYSKKNAQYPVVVVYGYDIRYRAWYIANELWPFDRVVYVNYNGGEYVLDNETLKTAEKFIIYMDCPEDILESLIAQNDNLNTYSMVRHDQFFYIYEVE